jgi:hypothetical protein
MVYHLVEGGKRWGNLSRSQGVGTASGRQWIGSCKNLRGEIQSPQRKPVAIVPAVRLEARRYYLCLLTLRRLREVGASCLALDKQIVTALIENYPTSIAIMLEEVL